MIAHLSEEELENKLADTKGVIIVDFFASWCGPCELLSEVLEEIYDEKTDWQIYKIDTDEETNLVLKYEIEAVPTMIIFKEGKKIRANRRLS